MKNNLYGNPDSLRKRSTCYIVNEEKKTVLLGKKREGIGEGNLVAIGGKVDDNETPLETIKRETLEEIGVSVVDVEEYATLHFYFPHKPEWNQTVIVHICTKWDGDPITTEEIEPEWIAIDEIPFDRMWEDARVYLPILLSGRKLEAEIEYATDNSVNKMRFEIIK